MGVVKQSGAAASMGGIKLTGREKWETKWRREIKQIVEGLHCWHILIIWLLRAVEDNYGKFDMTYV